MSSSSSSTSLTLLFAAALCAASVVSAQPRRYQPFVDPHPPDPLVNGKTPPYRGPARGHHVLPLCDYFNATDLQIAMAENPNYVAPIPTLLGRNDLARVAQCESMKVGVELGVQRGQFADHMLRYWPVCTEYWLVDLWRQQENYVDDANVDNAKQNEIMQTALATLAPWKEKVKICRNFTTECAKRFPDNYFDYIYVDARHDRLGVLADLESWWPKLKRGGIIAGHDYVTMSSPELELRQDWSVNFDGSRDQSGLATRGAIDDFFMSPQSRHTAHHRQLNPCYREMTYSSWSVRK